MPEQFLLKLISLACAVALIGGAWVGCGKKDQGRAPLLSELPESDPLPVVVSQPEYLVNPPEDPRAAIQAALDDGTLAKTGDDLTFLREVLEVAGVPEASQVLVFSKTSHQDHIINPSNPRALYFSDDCYIGWVPRGVIEYSDVDPKFGTGFFILDQQIPPPHTFTATASCLTCHEGGRTNGRPGLMVRSVFPNEDGFPIGGAGSFMVNHDTPLHDRWGGWYVTGEHGRARHMGNVTMIEPEDHRRPPVDREAGANITDLSPYFRTDRYLRPTSDIVALMVLEHQIEMHNLLTQGGMIVREQEIRSRSISEQLGEHFEPSESDTLMRVLDHQSDKILAHMLFANEFQLEDPVHGDEAFVRAFRANRHIASGGQSLKDFDLQTRLFKYRCSYMIYSRAFKQLPDLLKDAVCQKLVTGLSAEDRVAPFAHLDDNECEAILAILRETCEAVAAYTQQ